MKITLTREEYTGSITNLFRKVAEKLGAEETEDTKYDCTKILASKTISDSIFYYMQNVEGLDRMTAGMLWLCYGPKTSESLGEDEVDVEEGFIA